MAGFQPVAYMAAYAASKGFILQFTEALWAEVHDKGVTPLALCPGTTRHRAFRDRRRAGMAQKAAAAFA